jgi:hypothetical protein
MTSKVLRQKTPSHRGQSEMYFNATFRNAAEMKGHFGCRLVDTIRVTG